MEALEVGLMYDDETFSESDKFRLDLPLFAIHMKGFMCYVVLYCVFGYSTL